jgi:hypothetical protein
VPRLAIRLVDRYFLPPDEELLASIMPPIDDGDKIYVESYKPGVSIHECEEAARDAPQPTRRRV